MYFGTAGLTLWSEDYFKIIGEIEIKPDFVQKIETPDETYYTLYWSWERLCEITKVFKLVEDIRHSFISISEEGKIVQDFKTGDYRGCDEEFYDLMSWYGGIEINGNKIL